MTYAIPGLIRISSRNEVRIMLRKTLLTLLGVAVLTVATHAGSGLKVRLRVNSEDVALKNAVEQQFRIVLGDVWDLQIVGDGGPVDAVIWVNALATSRSSLTYSTTVIDMDSYLMAARDVDQGINVGQLQGLLNQRGISGTISFANVSTCGFGSLHASVTALIKELNSTSLMDLRNALQRYGSPTAAANAPSTSRPPLGS
jgi:hypothetical protein